MALAEQNDDLVSPQLGVLLKELREQRGLTQQNFATRVGVSVRAVTNWENGHSEPRGSMPKIEQVLGVRIVRRGDEWRAQSAAPAIDDTDQVETDGAEGRVVLYYRPGFLDGMTEDERERIIARGRHAVLEEAARIRRERGE